MNVEQLQRADFMENLIRSLPGPGGEQLLHQLKQSEKEERCLTAAIKLTVVLMCISVAGLCYAGVLAQNFSFHTPQLGARLLGALGLASLVCAVYFTACWCLVRQQTARLHFECRQWVLHTIQINPRQ